MSGRHIFERVDVPVDRLRGPSIGGRSAASLCWCITLAMAAAAPLYAQVTTVIPPPQPAGYNLPDSPSAQRYPSAIPVPEPGATKVTIESDGPQIWKDDKVTLDGNVVITYGGYIVQADHVDYDRESGDTTATGRVHITGGEGSEIIDATRATLNMRSKTGRFYDVHGSIGVKPTLRGNMYTNDNPFLFTGRVVIKTGPQEFEILDGSVTSCALPKPDWQLEAARFTVKDGKAHAKNTIFRLLNIPLIFLPYVTTPTAPDQRQAGFLIPILGNSSTKGFVIGEEIYMPMGRSAALTVGAQFYSRRGWEQSATFNLRGRNLDFIKAHYSGLLDRGYYQQQAVTAADGTTSTQNVYVNQGGEDMTVSGRKDFTGHTRVAGSAEYLSSFPYREAFTDNFNQAVSSDITSYAYGTHQGSGYVSTVEIDRYQGLKVVSTGEQIRIFHSPQIVGEALERRLGTTPVLWSATSQFTMLKRSQGTASAQDGFTSDLVSRLDIHPRLSLPFQLAGFSFRPSVGLRDTYYSHSRQPTPLPGPPPIEKTASLNRLVTEAEMEVRMPTLERTFETGPFMRRFLGSQAKHTIEPELHYRFASGVDNFAQTLRFDDTDVVSNKNELEYGFTQRLFLKPTRRRDCETGETPSELDGKCGGTRETLRWKLLQRRYFDDTFGGVIVTGRRNVLDTTLDFSGVAFLTERRSLSPFLSQMKLSATDHIDVEWDMNYDTHAGKFTQNNTFLDYHAGNYFGGMSYARLNAPGRFTTASTTSTTATTTSLTSDFSQLRLLAGYGTPAKPGLSAAANIGLDLKLQQVQYATAQLAYNWNCCGFSAEYRKYELGSVRNENAYRFNFTLVNIGTAGNLRRAERLF